MKQIVKALLALALCLALLPGTALAGLAGVDAAFSDYLDINSDVRFAVSAQLDSLLPYGEETISMLNGVLKHVQVGAALVGDTTTLRIGVDGQSVLELTETVSNAGSQLTTPLLPNRTLRSSASALNVLTGSNPAGEQPFDALLAIREVEGCYKELTDAITPYAEEKAANYTIKGVGTSRWSRIARLTPEQSEALSLPIANVLGCGMDAAYREQLGGLSYGKGFIVGLYQAEKGGADLAVYLKGDVTFADGTAGKLSYQWATAAAKGTRTDTYKFELTKTRAPRNDRVIAATFRRAVASAAPSLKGECAVTLRSAEGTTTTTREYDLGGRENDGTRSLKGTASVTVKATVDGDTATTSSTLTPDLLLTSEDGSGVLSGTVGLTMTTGKNTTCALMLTFDSEPARQLNALADNGGLYAVSDTGEVPYDPMPASSLTQNEEALATPADDYLVGQPPVGLTAYTPPRQMQTLDLDEAEPALLDALRGELSQNLAGRLLLALAALPAEDRALLGDNMSSNDFSAFLKLVNAR